MRLSIYLGTQELEAGEEREKEKERLKQEEGR